MVNVGNEKTMREEKDWERMNERRKNRVVCNFRHSSSILSCVLMEHQKCHQDTLLMTPKKPLSSILFFFFLFSLSFFPLSSSMTSNVFLSFLLSPTIVCMRVTLMYFLSSFLSMNYSVFSLFFLHFLSFIPVFFLLYFLHFFHPY